jgi:pimeloyl-ACP methyl ester carboxylesterase
LLDLPRSALLDVGGPVHVADYGGERDAPLMICLHGLGNSHVSWRQFAAQLTEEYRVLAVDMPGHGRSPRAGRSAGVRENRVVLDRILAELDAGPVTVVGHSMGATLAMLQAASRPDSIAALALLAPPTPRGRAELVSPALAPRVALCTWPWLARQSLDRRLQKLGAEAFVKRGLELTCASADTVDPVTWQLTVELLETQAAGEDHHVAVVEAARSLGLIVARASEYRRAIESIDCPTVVLQGDADRLVSPQGLHRLTALQPQWLTGVLEGVGHSPHLEAPELTARATRNLLHIALETWADPVAPVLDESVCA